ncbi:hypothetical protein VQ056_24590 [Paenibacillus sp. JTLBN-2024]
MIVSSNQLGQSLYCSQCGKENEQINVWWKDGRNDDGLGYSEVFAECPACHAQLMKKNMRTGKSALSMMHYIFCKMNNSAFWGFNLTAARQFFSERAI